MEILERTLEDIIFQNSQNKKGREYLAQKGLLVPGKLYRQVELDGYGRLDLLSILLLNGDLHITIYELKREKVGMQTFIQSCRYMEALKNIVTFNTNKKAQFKIVLIGNGIKEDDGFAMLYNYLDFVTVVLYDYDMSGINFHEKDKDYMVCDTLRPEKYKLPVSDIREMITIDKIELGF